MSYQTPLGFACKLSVNDNSGSQAVFTNPVKINAPWLSPSKVSTLSMDSTSNIETFIPGKIDPGTVMCEQHYSAADYNRLVAIGVTTKIWLVTAATDGTTNGSLTWTFSGFLTKVDVEMETESLIKCKFEIAVSGAITFGHV